MLNVTYLSLCLDYWMDFPMRKTYEFGMLWVGEQYITRCCEISGGALSLPISALLQRCLFPNYLHYRQLKFQGTGGIR